MKKNIFFIVFASMILFSCEKKQDIPYSSTTLQDDFDNVISKIDKNQYCTIKSIGVPDAMNGEVSVSVYFPYKDERTFMEDMKWNDIWFKIHTEDNNVGYVLGKHLRLSK